jgi:hypothetical protein
MFTVVILALIAGLIGYLLGREFQERAAKRQREQEGVVVEATAVDEQSATATSPTMRERLQKLNPFARTRTYQEEWETWLTHSADESLQAWYNAADAKEQKAFAHEVNQFAQGFGVKLAWLNDASLRQNAPDMYASLESLVNGYGAAYRQAITAKPQADVLNQLSAWEAHPAAHDHHALTEKLYAQVIATGETTHILPEGGPARKQREAMVEVLQAYRAQKPAAFYELFTAVVQNTATEPEAETAAEAVSETPAEPATPPTRTSRTKRESTSNSNPELAPAA